jgi:hypothetical protein
VRARDHIIEQLLSLGLEGEVQKAVSTTRWNIGGAPYSAGSVQNVLARLPGTNSTGALLLMAHYDSVATGPGAADDGAGVATLLEILRALRGGPPLRNDVIVAFTDGEEDGGLGSQAFVDESPLAKVVSVALVVDSGGSCGRAALVAESTHQHNGWVVRQMAEALHDPVAASILDDFRSLAASGDDLNLYPKGIEVIGSGITGCLTTYHTAQDTVSSLDPRSVQDLGASALALARRIGSVDLRHVARESVVYFTFFGRLVLYPVSWVAPLTLLILAMLVGVLFLGVRRGRFEARGLGVAFLLWLAGLLVSSGLVAFLWRALETLHLLNRSFVSAYNATSYGVGFVALAVAVTSALYSRFCKGIGASSLTAGGLIFCAVPMVLASLVAPGASFLFSWPLASALLPVGLEAAESKRPDFWRPSLARSLCAVPSLYLFPLLIGYLTTTLDGSASGTISLVVVTTVFLALLGPQLEVLTNGLPGLLSGTCALLATGLILFGALRSGYDAQHPRPDTISYWLDADSGRAFWVSFDEKPDNWTSQFLTGHVERAPLRLFNPAEGDLVLKVGAPRIHLPPPSLETLEDSVVGRERRLRLRLASPREARILWIQVEKATVLTAAVEGRRMQVNDGDRRNKVWGLVYLGVPSEGVGLDLTLSAAETPQLTLIDQSDGLPSFPGLLFEGRPVDRMALPTVWPYFDSTLLVSHTFANVPQQEAARPPP